MLFSVVFVVASILVVAALRKLYNNERDPLDQLPGPPQFPVVGNALAFIGLKQDEMFTKLREFVNTYGDRFIIRIFNRKILQISSPQDIEVVLSSSKNITKSYPYTLLQPWLGTGLLLSTGSKWYSRRKILTPTFHFNILNKFRPIIEDKSREMVSKLLDSAGENVNLVPIVSDFTLQTICETAMGTRLDSDKSTAVSEYKSAILSIGLLALRRLTTFWFRNPVIFALSQTGRNFKQALKKVHAFADQVILERKKMRSLNEHQGRSGASVLDDVDDEEEVVAGSRRRLAMMDLLLNAETRGEIDLDGIRDEVNTFMFEGHDTTAMAITFGLMLLADHQDVQDKVHRELEGILCGRDGAPSVSDLAAMKYTEAVIKETLRLYPSVPFIARLVTEDFMLGDLRVCKGTEVAVHIYDLHRRADSYPDPGAFRPERFLEGPLPHPYAYVPFSAGPRNCVGQRFAMQEMKTILSEVCRSFRLQPPDSRVGRPALLADMVLRPLHPIYVKFIKR